MFSIRFADNKLQFDKATLLGIAKNICCSLTEFIESNRFLNSNQWASPINTISKQRTQNIRSCRKWIEKSI